MAKDIQIGKRYRVREYTCGENAKREFGAVIEITELKNYSWYYKTISGNPPYNDAYSFCGECGFKDSLIEVDGNPLIFKS